jgi:hypothetical protein
MGVNEMDYYQKLKPYTNIERCKCDDRPGLLLVYLFTDNPINCYRCKKEIDPEKIMLTPGQVDLIASCFNVYGSLYNLWIDSGEYEQWAKSRLLDRKGQVNISGMKLAESLSEGFPTYYWWFWDADDGDPECCPNCNAPLDKYVYWGTGKCDKCRIII